jgi:hypothetical protein
VLAQDVFHHKLPGFEELLAGPYGTAEPIRGLGLDVLVAKVFSCRKERKIFG